MRVKFDPFSLYFGTSAGAQNLSAYLCSQPGYARKVIMRYTTRRDFFDPLCFVRGGNLIDLDWLVNSTATDMPLAMDYAGQRFADGSDFYMCACRQDDYTASYFAPTSSNWLDLIRVSSAIPGFYRQGVTLDGNSMALGSRLPALREDYKTGRLCGRYFLATLGKLLAEQPPLVRYIPHIATTAPLMVPPAVVANDALARPVMDVPQANDPTFNKEEQA